MRGRAFIALTLLLAAASSLARAADAERGRYLALAGNCGACHTRPGGEPFAGGLAFETPFGTIYSSNITPDAKTGIGRWSATDVVWFLQTNLLPDGDGTQGLMAEVIDKGYRHLEESDLKAIAAYLKSLPPIENEFFLAYRKDDGFVPVDRSLCFSAIGMESTEPVIQDIIAALTEQGLTVELSHPELGWGQQELSIRHAPALRAADNQITYRQTVRAVAAQHGMVATLAPKPWADQAGSGAHLHWSIWDVAHTTNRLADPEGLAGLSTLARQAIAGVLTHLPALLGMTTPSVNSFRRLQPHFWSSAYTAWGIENREAAVRVPTRYWDDEAGSTNLELKASDSSANPYIALGGVMAAALDGIERELDPGEPVNEDPGNLSDAERERRGIKRFPLTASEALDELEWDEVLTSAMGEGLATEYLKVRRADAAAYAEHDEAYELDQHFFKY